MPTISLSSRERERFPASFQQFDPLLQRPHHLSPKIGIEQSSDGELSDLASDRESNMDNEKSFKLPI